MTVPSIAAKLINTSNGRPLINSEYIHFRMVPRVDDIIQIIDKCYRVVHVVHVFDFPTNSPEIVVEVRHETFRMKAPPTTVRHLVQQ